MRFLGAVGACVSGMVFTEISWLASETFPILSTALTENTYSVPGSRSFT